MTAMVTYAFGCPCSIDAWRGDRYRDQSPHHQTGNADTSPAPRSPEHPTRRQTGAITPVRLTNAATYQL